MSEPVSSTRRRILLISDIHYGSDLECARGDYESRTVSQPLLRYFLKMYRRLIWRRDPFAMNGLLDTFIDAESSADLCLGLGDYSCDSAFIGVADYAAFQSARLCLSQLRRQHGSRFVGIIGDHDLGKKSMFGGVGGMDLASYDRCLRELRLSSLFYRSLGRVHLIGMNSSLITLPSFEVDCDPDQLSSWYALRETHLEELEACIQKIPAGDRLLFFLHDPSALPFLSAFPWIRRCFSRLDGTWVGHLHAPCIFELSHYLSGMPVIDCMGTAVHKMSQALHARHLWKPFKVHLVPAPGGIERCPQGGYGELWVDPEGLQAPVYSIKSLTD